MNKELFTPDVVALFVIVAMLFAIGWFGLGVIAAEEINKTQKIGRLKYYVFVILGPISMRNVQPSNL